ncbi:MAG: SlyX family protein [Granulosicoccus sp.]|nr:SlyX family protein [Granulosicoccus sp.]
MSERDSQRHRAVDARIEILELKLMDLESTVQELNDVILRQYRDIERLHSLHLKLSDALQGSNENPANPTLRDELPPHY